MYCFLALRMLGYRIFASASSENLLKCHVSKIYVGFFPNENSELSRQELVFYSDINSYTGKLFCKKTF